METTAGVPLLDADGITPQNRNEIVNQIHNDLKRRTEKDADNRLREGFNKEATNIIKQKIANEDTLTSDDVGNLIEEIKGKPRITPLKPMPIDPEQTVSPSLSTNPAKRKAFEETKKMMDTFREKTASYPKYISYEGSMVLCVMLSMKDVAVPHITNLPSVDQETLRGLLPEKVAKKLDYFEVRFDENKDFRIQIFQQSVSDAIEDSPIISINMLNSVAHPRPEDLKDINNGAVPIENDGDRIAVGGKIIMDKRKLQSLGGIQPSYKWEPPKKDIADEEPSLKRQPVAGRNAYEIRADVLQMAIDWSRGEHVCNKYASPESVLQLAKQFYSFVEQRR